MNIYVIFCEANTDLFWSNETGWGDFDGCDRFTEHEKETLNLPLEGAWLRVEP